MIKKYVLYVDMYDDHAEVCDKDDLSTSELIAIIYDLFQVLAESWLNV